MESRQTDFIAWIDQHLGNNIGARIVKLTIDSNNPYNPYPMRNDNLLDLEKILFIYKNYLFNTGRKPWVTEIEQYHLDSAHQFNFVAMNLRLEYENLSTPQNFALLVKHKSNLFNLLLIYHSHTNEALPPNVMLSKQELFQLYISFAFVPSLFTHDLLGRNTVLMALHNRRNSIQNVGIEIAIAQVGLQLVAYPEKQLSRPPFEWLLSQTKPEFTRNNLTQLDYHNLLYTMNKLTDLPAHEKSSAFVLAGCCVKLIYAHIADHKNIRKLFKHVKEINTISAILEILSEKNLLGEDQFAAMFEPAVLASSKHFCKRLLSVASVRDFSHLVEKTIKKANKKLTWDNERLFKPAGIEKKDSHKKVHGLAP